MPLGTRYSIDVPDRQWSVDPYASEYSQLFTIIQINASNIIPQAERHFFCLGAPRMARVPHRFR